MMTRPYGAKGMNTTTLIISLIAVAMLGGVLLASRIWIARHWRAVLPRLPLPTLALAASYGVYSFAALFVPTWVAIVQAAAFELTYIGLAAVSGMGPSQRKRAAMVSIAAVVVSVVYNTLAGLFHRNPDWLMRLEPWHEWGLALLHGAPLAWVAYVVAQLLLHTEPVQRPRIIAQRRTLIRRLIAEIRQGRYRSVHLQQELAQVQVKLAQRGEVSVREIAQLQQELAQAQTEFAQHAAGTVRNVAQLQQELAQARSELTRRDESIAQLQQELAQKQTELTRIREEAEQAGGLDLRGLAQWCASLGAEGREIARRLGRSESTVRSWLKAARASAAD